jgi:hypothetical protein
VIGLATALAFTALASPSPLASADAVTIRNGAALSAGGFIIEVRAHGPLLVSDKNGTREVNATPKSVAELFAQVRGPEPPASVQVRSCRHLMSGGGPLAVEYKGSRTPGDLSCGGDAAARALLAAANGLIAQAGVAPPPLRRRPAL